MSALEMGGKENISPLIGKIVIRDSNYFSVIGKSEAQISKFLGERILKLLDIQKSVSKVLASRPDLLALVSMLNCRKVAALATSQTTLTEALNTSLGETRTAEAILDGIESEIDTDKDGILNMFRDIQRLLNGGSIPSVWTPASERLTSQLEDAELPAIVHFFEIKNKASIPRLLLEIATRNFQIEDLLNMGFVHTIVVTGRDKGGEYHCFHKQGPSVKEKLEVTTLQDLFANIFGDNLDTNYLSILGSIN